MRDFNPDIELTDGQELEAAQIEDILKESSQAMLRYIARLLANEVNSHQYTVQGNSHTCKKSDTPFLLIRPIRRAALTQECSSETGTRLPRHSLPVRDW